MRWLVALGLLAAAACGGEPRRLEMKKVKVEAPVEAGPKASPEEAAGEVPPLKGIVKAFALVPEKLVPPAAPPDPTFEPE